MLNNEISYLREVNRLLSEELFYLRTLFWSLEQNQTIEAGVISVSETQVAQAPEIEPSKQVDGYVCPQGLPSRRIGQFNSETQSALASGIEPTVSGGGGAYPPGLRCRSLKLTCSETQYKNTGIESSELKGGGTFLQDMSRRRSGTERLSVSACVGPPLPHPFAYLRLKEARFVRADTPRSTSGLVYNYLNNVDVGVSFAFCRKGVYYLSKGAKIVMKRGKIAENEWSLMRKV